MSGPRCHASITRQRAPDVHACLHSLFIWVVCTNSRHCYTIANRSFCCLQLRAALFQGNLIFSHAIWCAYADWMVTFSVWTLYGWHLREFRESDDDSSAEEDFILVVHFPNKTTNGNSRDCAVLAVGDCPLLNDMQCKSWPPTCILLQVPLAAEGIKKHLSNKYPNICLLHLSVLSAWHPKCAERLLTGTTAYWVRACDCKGLNIFLT